MSKGEYKIIWKEGSFFEKGHWRIVPKNSDGNGAIIAMIVIIVLLIVIGSIFLMSIPVWSALLGFQMIREKRFIAGIIAIVGLVYFHIDMSNGWISSLLFHGWTSSDSEMTNGILGFSSCNYFLIANYIGAGLGSGFIADAILINRYGRKFDDGRVTLPQVGIYLIPITLGIIIASIIDLSPLKESTSNISSSENEQNKINNKELSNDEYEQLKTENDNEFIIFDNKTKSAKVILKDKKLFVNTENDWVILENDENLENVENFHKYEFLKYFDEINSYLFEIQYYEGIGYLIISQKTGAMLEIPGQIKVSPDKKRFITYDNIIDNVYAQNTYQIFFIKEGNYVKEFESKSGGASDANWIDDLHLIVKRKEEDGSVTIIKVGVGAKDWGEYFLDKDELETNGVESINSKTVNGTSPPLKDIDGNNYSTIVINGKTWMNENLKTRKFNDGKIIPIISNADKFTHYELPAIYGNVNNDDFNKYGLYYNWYSVNTNRVCPMGWRIPTHNEIVELIKHYGGETLSLNNLESLGFSIQYDGFIGGPGGNYSRTDNYGIWWTSTDYNKSEYVAYAFDISKDIKISTTLTSKSQGFCLRCIKDN